MIRNVHTRVIPVPPEELAPWLERIPGADSPIWPTSDWPAMVLDNGVEVGSKGGHGPVRYHVTDYRPGSRIEFTFERGFLYGTHAMELHDGPRPGTTLVRHSLIAAPESMRARVAWTLMVRWMHDKCLEQCLDNLAAAVGHAPTRRTKTNALIRLLQKRMMSSRPRPEQATA